MLFTGSFDHTAHESTKERLAKPAPATGGHCLSRPGGHLLQPTSWPRPGCWPVGMVSPAEGQPSCSRIEPVPLIVTVLTTMAKHEKPLLDLLTAPLNVSLA